MTSALRATRSIGRIARVGTVVRRFGSTLAHGEHAGIVDHLDELRFRILVSAGALVGGFTVGWLWRGSVLSALNAPLPDGVSPVTLGVAEPFMTSIRISLYVAVSLALPVLLWQGWAFVAPSFDRAARRTAMWFVLGGAVLFVGGAAFGYAVALPRAVDFLTTFDAHRYDVQVRAQDYYTFAAAVVVALGLVAQLPVVLLGCVRFGVVSHAQLARNRRVAVVVLTAIAVALPGVDPVLTALQIIPLLVLFELTLVLARILERRWRDDPADGSAAASVGCDAAS